MDKSMELRIINKLNTKKLEQLTKRRLHILVGYPEGEATVNGMDSAALAERLATEPLGKKKRGWNFLLHGIKAHKEQVTTLLKLYAEGKVDAKTVGLFGAIAIVNFVKQGSYTDTNPNESRYLLRKIREHREMRPLIIDGSFIDACTYKIKDKG
jgi:hypothetical protein